MNEDDLSAIAESHDLYISPFREDGTTHGTPTLVWPLLVDGKVVGPRRQRAAIRLVLIKGLVTEELLTRVQRLAPLAEAEV